MNKGTGFGKTILIGDQFVLEEVPAIVSAISYETETTVERLKSGAGWILEDNRIEVPGYKKKKEEQQAQSIDKVLEAMKIDVKKIQSKSLSAETYWREAGSARARPAAFRWRGH